jgi:hypothetical protein
MATQTKAAKELDELVEALKDTPDDLLTIIFVGVEWVDDRAYGLGMDAEVMDKANHLRFRLEAMVEARKINVQELLRRGP